MGCLKLAYYENPAPPKVVCSEKKTHSKKCANYSYFGARYYMSDVSVWLSVDPLKENYAYQSPYTYCGWNPIRIIDPDGRGEDDWVKTENGKVVYDSRVTDQKTATTLYGSGSTYIPNGYTCTINGNTIQLKNNGVYTINGVSGIVMNEGYQYQIPKYPASGRCDFSPINIEDLIGVALIFKGGLKLLGIEGGEKLIENSGPIIRSVGAASRSEMLAKALKLNINSPVARQVLNSLDMSVETFISTFRKGSIKSVFPKEYMGKTVEEALKSGNTTVRKLLIDGRFIK